MKRYARFTVWLSLLLIATLLPAACTRTIDRETPEEVATEVAPVLDDGVPTPTVAPVSTPADGAPGDAAYPGPDSEAEGQTEGEATEPATTEPAPAAETPPDEGVVTPPETDIVYQVQAGDTLTKIAERFGVSVNDIAAANQLSNIHRLEVGQSLIIPAAGSTTTAGGQGEATVHIVQPGDTLYRIGLLYGFTVDELATFNNLANPNSLEVGQEIRIPPGN